MDVVAVMISRRLPGTELSDKPSACHNLQALPQHGNVLRRARRVLHDSNPWLPGESGLHLSRMCPCCVAYRRWEVYSAWALALKGPYVFHQSFHRGRCCILATASSVVFFGGAETGQMTPSDTCIVLCITGGT